MNQPGSALPPGGLCPLEPLRVPWEVIRAVARSSSEERVLVVVDQRRERDLVELRQRVFEKWPDRVHRTPFAGELSVDTGKRRIRLRFSVFQRHAIDSSWRPDVVVVDQDLPVAVLGHARSAARSRTVPW